MNPESPTPSSDTDSQTVQPPQPHFAPEDISDIPPEILAKLNLGGPVSHGMKVPGGFSWAALVYGPFYYGRMKDWPFMWASILTGVIVYTLPVWVLMAFFARKRAWEKKEWGSDEEFWRTQKQWDRSAIVGGILSVIFLFVAGRYILSIFQTNFGTTDPNALLKQVQDMTSQ